jgi:hypothetical protein
MSARAAAVERRGFFIPETERAVWEGASESAGTSHIPQELARSPKAK